MSVHYAFAAFPARATIEVMKTHLSIIGGSVAFVLAAFFAPVAASAATVNIGMHDDYYTPQTITINSGDTVVWTNNGTMAHTVTSDTGLFNSTTIQPGGTFAATFNTPGTYGYHCSFHGSAGSGMYGTITVGLTSTNVPVSSLTNPNAAFNSNVNASTNTYVGATTQTTTSGANAAQLIAQIQALIAQINALQGGSGTVSNGTSSSGGGVSSCPQIGRSLGLGSTGADVTRLQQYLALDPSIYPNAQITGYYGALTQAAVQRWQTKFHIVSLGTPGSTGYGTVGPRTASAIAIVCGGGTVNGVTGVTAGGTGAGVVSGYIQVAPISGNAPLNVTITATVNTANSCSGATYALSYGDGTAAQQIIVAAGSCNQAAQTFTHTYQYGGSYQIVLSAAGHQSTATVTVTGPANPNISGTGTTPATPTGTLSAFVTSGTAPLAVTFYVSCAAGVAYDVVYGDGQELGGAGVSGTACNGGLQSIAHTYSAAGSYNAQLMIFSQNAQGAVVPHPAATQAITVTGPATSTTSNSNLLPMSIATSQNGNPFSVSVQFNIPNCPAFSLNWGDGSSSIYGVAGACGTGGSTTPSYSHTYAQTGTYTLTLVRGTQTDTAAFAVTN